MPAPAPLPDVVIHAIRDFFGLLFAERWSRQCSPEIVENEHLDLSLGASILRPVVHGSVQLSQGSGVGFVFEAVHLPASLMQGC